MTKSRTFLVAGVALALMLALAGIVGAQQGKRARAMARGFGIGQFARGLNLTPDQKAQIKGVIAKNKSQFVQVRIQMLQARLDLLKGNPNAAGELAGAQVAAVNLRTSLLEQIKPVLTSDQLAQLQQRQQQREQRLQNRLDRLNKRAGG